MGHDGVCKKKQKIIKLCKTIKKRARKKSPSNNIFTPLRDLVMDGEKHPSVRPFVCPSVVSHLELRVRVLSLRNAALRLISDYLRGLGELETP